MGRLIDEDDVKNWLQKRADGYGSLYPSGSNRADELKIIKEELDIRVPTAYNLDRVMEQLEEFRPELEQHGCGGILTDMIEVVEKGGIE